MLVATTLLSIHKQTPKTDSDWAKLWQNAAQKQMIEIRGAAFTRFVPPTEKPLEVETLLITNNQRDWEITDFPAALFPKLRFLYLYNARLTAISFRGVLPCIEIIDIAQNKLTTFALPATFPALQSLQLYHNANLQTLKGIGQQRSLLQLDCQKCALTAIADLLPLLQRGLPLTVKIGGGVGIHIAGNNTIADCPMERLEQGAAAVVKYFKDIRRYGKKTVYDLKVMLVGDRAAGKTALYKLLTAPEGEHIPIYPGSISSTARIIPIEHEYQHDDKTYEIYLWDFAGDVEMQPQHQFFITPRGLFLFLINARDFGQINEQHKRNYWLNAMNQLSRDSSAAKNSTVVMILNRRDAHTKPQVNLDTLRQRYTHLNFIQEDIDFQNEDKNTPDGKIFDKKQNKKDTAKLITNIKDAIANYVGAGREQSTNETDIKQALEKLKEDGKRYITWQDYEAICQKNGYKEAQDINDLAAIFMRLGVFHYFPKHLSYLFLDFDWLSKSIYDFLNYLRSAQKYRFTDDEAKAYWQTQLPNPADCCHDAAMHEHLLHILRIDGFESVYEIKETNENIVPALLSEAPPAYTLPSDALPVVIRLVYARYVHTILWRTIVRLSNNIAQQGGHSIAWQNGVVFDLDGCKVSVRHEGEPDKGSQLDMIAVGKGDKKAAITRVWNTILDIHDHPRQTYDYERLVPCNCDDCKNPTNKTDYIKYTKLNNLRAKNKATSDCENGGQYQVQALLEGIEATLPISSDRDHFQKAPEAPKRKILFMAANGKDAARIQTDKEYNAICDKYDGGGDRDAFDLVRPRFAMTIENLLKDMAKNNNIDIVHFAGHGKEEGLKIVNTHNKEVLLPNRALELLFKQYSGKIKLIILSCCYSETQAEFLSKLGFYVIGATAEAEDESLLAFMIGFYIGLFEGKEIEHAFEYGLVILATECPDSTTQLNLWKDGSIIRKFYADLFL